MLIANYSVLPLVLSALRSFCPEESFEIYFKPILYY